MKAFSLISSFLCEAMSAIVFSILIVTACLFYWWNPAILQRSLPFQRRSSSVLSRIPEAARMASFIAAIFIAARGSSLYGMHPSLCLLEEIPTLMRFKRCIHLGALFLHFTHTAFAALYFQNKSLDPLIICGLCILKAATRLIAVVTGRGYRVDRAVGVLFTLYLPYAVRTPAAILYVAYVFLIKILEHRSIKLYLAQQKQARGHSTQ